MGAVITQVLWLIARAETGLEFMAFTVKVTREDGSVHSIGRLFKDMASASCFALQLADDIGQTYAVYQKHSSQPAAVLISEGRTIILEIKIFPGGLLPQPPFRDGLDLLDNTPRLG